MKNLLLVSGWFGGSKLNDYSNNRDGTSQFIYETVRLLEKSYNVKLDKCDFGESTIDLEIHYNFQKSKSKSKKICLLLEDACIRPHNILIGYARYDLVITWDRSLARRNQNFIWVPYPHDYNEGPVDGLMERSLDFVMFGSNRNVLFSNSRSLYNERQKVVDFFETNEIYDFHLYGKDWNRPHCKSGFLSRLILEFSKLTDNFGRVNRRNWNGLAITKSNVLSNAKFNFCYENVLGIDGYVSEKIYDSIMYGSIPIYIPSSEMNYDLMPHDLYIDPRNYDDYESLVNYCLSITNSEYIRWQEKLRDYAKSRKSQVSSTKYAKFVLDTIANV